MDMAGAVVSSIIANKIIIVELPVVEGFRRADFWKLSITSLAPLLKRKWIFRLFPPMTTLFVKYYPWADLLVIES
jgi:hypothetical protein